jgi:ADP-heptose:LPS heptosyltransferase
MNFPAIALINRYWLGDGVLVEPIADALALESQCYVLSNYPELYIGHPRVKGIISGEEIKEEYRTVDISQSISSLKKHDDGTTELLPNKFGRMCEEAGFNRKLRAPKLYLTGTEWSDLLRARKWHKEPCVGIIMKSRHPIKDWFYRHEAIRRMVKKRWNVFVFSETNLPTGVHLITGRLPVRELMMQLALMDLVIGPDTGPVHIAAALGVPIGVICFEVMSDNYEIYPNVEIFESDNFDVEKGIKGIAPNIVIRHIESLLGLDRRINVEPQKRPETDEELRVGIIRMKGFGDLLSSLPAVATLKNALHSANGRPDHVSVEYITSPGGAKLLECTKAVDKIIAVDYDHAPYGLPLPPEDIDYSEYTSVHNMINAIDFVNDSDTEPRSELFARYLKVDEVDYASDDWKITVPEEWKDLASGKLGHYVNPNVKTIALQVDTKGLSRIWPKPRIREFCGLAAKRGFKVILLSDLVHTGYPKSAVNLTGQLSTEEYVGMIAICKIGLSCDSALMHIAGAMDKDAVALFGAVDPKLRIAHYKTVHPIVGKAKCVPCNDWQKASCKHKKHHPECMWSIMPKQVLEKLEEVYHER